MVRDLLPVLRIAILFGFGILLAATSFAASVDDELPGRVGRIAEFSGQLYLSSQQRPAEWEEIGVNYTVTTGDNLWVSSEGRAEIDYGGGQFRLAGDTSVHISRLDDSQFALFVAQGSIIIRVRLQDAGDATRVDTPNTQVTLTRPGLYRIDVAAAGEPPSTMVTVREGEALVALASGTQQSLPGQAVAVVGTTPANADIRNSIGVDGFDTWSANRDRRYERGRSTAYVSRQMIGHADLDEYGSWQSYADYGPVWFPESVPQGWAPYRDGYWTHVGGWGVTWVDSAPWGYAPFHYGRWAWIGSRWGWCPGAYVARPVWAPALVAWFGGRDWGHSLAGGAPIFAWVPLGWREPYFPPWRRCSLECWARHNRPSGIDVAARSSAVPTTYANGAIPGAMTAVTSAAFAGRRPVSVNALPLPASLATIAPVLGKAPELKPGSVAATVTRPAGLSGAPVPASSIFPMARSLPDPGFNRNAAAPRLPPGAVLTTGSGLSGAPAVPAAGTPGALGSGKTLPRLPAVDAAASVAPSAQPYAAPKIESPVSVRRNESAPAPAAIGSASAIPGASANKRIQPVRSPSLPMPELAAPVARASAAPIPAAAAAPAGARGGLSSVPVQLPPTMQPNREILVQPAPVVSPALPLAPAPAAVAAPALPVVAAPAQPHAEGRMAKPSTPVRSPASTQAVGTPGGVLAAP